MRIYAHLHAGIEFKDFNLGFRRYICLCTTLKCIEFFHKIWDSTFKSGIHGNRESLYIHSLI